MNRILFWNPAAVIVPVNEAAKAAMLESLAATRKMAPKGASAALLPAGSFTGGPRGAIKATQWGTILAKGTHPHEETPKGQAFKFKGGGFARGTITAGGIKPNPYIRLGAQTFPEFFRIALASRLRHF